MLERHEPSDDVNRLSEDDRQIERLLASLAPCESRVDRDRVMYLAGQASAVVSDRSGRGRLARWLWPAATACSASAGLVIGLLLAHARPAAAPPFARMPESTETLLRQEDTVSERPIRAMSAPAHESFASSGLRPRTPIPGVEADDTNRLADSFAFGKTATHLRQSATYPELLRQLLAERT
jgi:hypothetical protein